MPETSNFNLEKNAASKVHVDLKSYKCIHSEKSCSQMFRKKQPLLGPPRLLIFEIFSTLPVY
jgi:hypothetical protein